MEIIRSIPLRLDATIDAESGSSYPSYSATGDYARGDRVYSDPADGGDGQNYELIAHAWENGAPVDPGDYPRSTPRMRQSSWLKTDTRARLI